MADSYIYAVYVCVVVDLITFSIGLDRQHLPNSNFAIESWLEYHQNRFSEMSVILSELIGMSPK